MQRLGCPAQEPEQTAFELVVMRTCLMGEEQVMALFDS